jgi:hypothetical protein
MNKDEALEILKQHNLWRRNQDDVNPYEMCDPKELGEAIDCVVEALQSEASEQEPAIEPTYIEPTYYVLHPDGTYSEAIPQPSRY